MPCHCNPDSSQKASLWLGLLRKALPKEGLEQLPGRGEDEEDGGEDVRSCSSSVPELREAAKRRPGLPKLGTAPAVPARLSGAPRSHKPASTPIICFLKKMRFV